jgi:hypothetical protein
VLLEAGMLLRSGLCVLVPIMTPASASIPAQNRPSSHLSQRGPAVSAPNRTFRPSSSEVFNETNFHDSMPT